MIARIKRLRTIEDELALHADELHDEENENMRAASASLRKAGWLVEDAVDHLRRETVTASANGTVRMPMTVTG